MVGAGRPPGRSLASLARGAPNRRYGAVRPWHHRFMRIVALGLSLLVAASLVLATTPCAASILSTSESALKAELPVAGSLGQGWGVLLPAKTSQNSNVPVGGGGCGSVKSSRGDEATGYYDSSEGATLAVSLISVANASRDFARFKRIYLSGCLEAIRVQGRTARSHYKVVPRFTSDSGIGIQANTFAFGRDTYEFLYCAWKGSVLAVFYYRGLSQPDSSILQAVISGFRH